MKVGDLYEFEDASGWYIWLKHKVTAPAPSPMAFATGAWILGLYSGESPMRALQAGELAEVLYFVKRNSRIKLCGTIKVLPQDITHRTFLHYRSVGPGKTEILLCRGYEVLRNVETDEIIEDVRLGIGMNVLGIPKAVAEGNIERIISRSKLKPVADA